MKLPLLILSAALLATSARAATFTNSADADAFVRAAAPSSNYGGAGALAVSGAGATNNSGVMNGAFDTFLRFNTAALVASFNTQFGPDNWLVTGAKLQLMEVGAPNNALFNRGKGRFEIRWIANDTWVEGTGTPMLPTTDGIAYNTESSVLNSNADLSLGVFTNAGADGALTCPLPLPPAFANDLIAGGEVSFYFTAVDSGIGFTFDSRSFGTSAARPYLLVSALPPPGNLSLSLVDSNLVITATNGVAGGTYYLLGSTNLSLPLDQWSPLGTNLPTSNGPFSLTLTNAVNNTAPFPQFFLLQAH